MIRAAGPPGNPPLSSPRPMTRLPSRLLLVRHGETSAPDLFHGAESDVGLGASGIAQAREAAARFAALRPAALYCSSMRRAIETARPIAAACGLDPVIVPESHERRMGPLSGSRRDLAWDDYRALNARWIARDLDYAPPGTESYAAVLARVAPALRSIADRQPGALAIVVTHGIVIRVAVTGLAAGMSPADFEGVAIDFLGGHELERGGDGVWRLVSTGEVPTEKSAANP